MPKRFFSFDLSEPVFGVKRLTCYEPTNAHRPLTCPMASMLLKAFNAVPKDEIKKEENTQQTEMSSKDIILLLKLGPGHSSDFYYAFFEKFKALMISSNICMMDNNKGMDDVTFDNLLVSDTDNLLGTYIINFILPSDILTKVE